MSRTIKTTPWAVRREKDPAKYALTVRDHRFFACDLPELPQERKMWMRHNTRCYYEPSKQLLYGRHSGCPCWMCHGSNSPDLAAKRRRHDKLVAVR
jgi:hypothetical protein